MAKWEPEAKRFSRQGGLMKTEFLPTPNFSIIEPFAKLPRLMILSR